MGFNSGFELVIDGTDGQIVLQLLERLLDLDQLQIEPPQMCVVSLSRQRYRLFGCTSAMSSLSKSPIALCSNQCRCNLHSLPGEINW